MENARACRRSRRWAAASGAILPRKVRAPRNAVPGNARRHWFRPVSGTVPQRRDRRWRPSGRTGKGETVRQERTARWATKAARQTPPGARPNRDGARISVRRAGTGPVIRVGCWRRRATAVREEWSPRGLTPLDRTRLTGVAGRLPATRKRCGQTRPRPASERKCRPAAGVFDSSEGAALPRRLVALRRPAAEPPSPLEAEAIDKRKNVAEPPRQTSQKW